MQHHPDKGGDPEQFKQIQGAYDILSDPQKRQNFDQFGSADGPQGGPGPNMNDIFSQMFGGSSKVLEVPSVAQITATRFTSR